ncbi:phosphatase PAP2 family protein [Streptomyces massasporeus]
MGCASIRPTVPGCSRIGFRTTRPRTVDSSSSSSGHTAAAVVCTAAVAPIWTSAGAVCAVPAAMAAVERVQSGAHYPSDVAVGAAIGLTGAWLVRRTKPGSALLALAERRYTVRAMHTVTDTRQPAAPRRLSGLHVRHTARPSSVSGPLP